MVQINWDRILSIKAVSLTDEEIEDLFPMVIRCDVESIDDIHNLKALMKLLQEMLQHKDNQVESLLLECDELKEKVHDAMSASFKSREKGQVSSDIISGSNVNSKREDHSMHLDYETVLKEKNGKIETLILELESLEKENMTLKEKLNILKDKMEDATEGMNEMTEELNVLQNKNIIYKEKMSEMECENKALITQVKAITIQQVDRDKIIDEFSAAIDARIIEWKNTLDEKDAEIARLKENLSQSLTQSVISAKDQNTSQIVYLNKEIDHRDKTIEELQNRLSEAVVEMNESATLIEKFKIDTRKMEKSSRRKQQRDLLRKLQDANEKISNLQNLLKQTEDDVELKSKQLCEILSTLKKYEDQDHGLTEMIDEAKELREQLHSKNNHIEDLVNVINKMEVLNSCREMEIAALREKLGMPEDETILIDDIMAKRKEETKKCEELKQKNKSLMEENLEMKSDIRTLRYKLKELEGRVVEPNDMLGTTSVLEQRLTKISEEYNWIAEQERTSQRHMTDIEDIKENVRIVIEENEALRKGMHEILDSIHDQDGKSSVEVQSDTLERLLEALDVRHLAGWYHPAMRLQGRLNVIQGSNAELRTQLKQIRRELREKDNVLRQIASTNDDKNKSPNFELFKNEEMGTYDPEVKRLQDTYQIEMEEWQREKDLLYEERKELNDSIAKLKVQLEEYQKNWQILEMGEDEVRKAFVDKNAECAEAAVRMITANKKYTMLEELLDKESAKIYQIQKESITKESNLKKALVDSEKCNKMMENEISALQSNLSNSMSILEYNDLKEKYEETCIRLRMALENELAQKDKSSKIEVLKEEIEILKQEKDQLIKHLQEQARNENKDDLERQLAEIKSKALIEQQRADHMTKLHEILQGQLAKCETDSNEIFTVKSELQEQVIELHKRLSKETRLQETYQSHHSENEIRELKETIKILNIQNENLKKTAEISQEEAQMHYMVNSMKTFELDSLRHQILDLQAVSEDKETIARLGFELTNFKASEVEANKQKLLLENDVLRLQEEIKDLKIKSTGSRAQMLDCQKQCESRCGTYLEVISFLQRQYAGSTSITALERFDSMLRKLINDRAEVGNKLKEAKECSENVKFQQDELTNRLQVVEQLKDILEQQIGSSDVQNIVQCFSKNSQHTLNELRYKRQITYLEHELQIANDKLIMYESSIMSMESEMISIQRVWNQLHEQKINQINEPELKMETATVETKSIFVQTQIESYSVAVQSEPCHSCSSEEDTVTKEETHRDIDPKVKLNDNNVIFLNQQLSQALLIASERSAMLIKYESQIAECQAKINALSGTIVDRDLQLEQKDKMIEQMKCDQSTIGIDGTDKVALKSTITSLQKIVIQKEETIARYQNLLKEDRDEHSKAASRLQEEIKGLHDQIFALQEEAKQRSKRIDNQVEPDDKSARLEELKLDGNRNIDLEEEVVKLHEKASTLEADLNIAKELGKRWHRLAEERLRHMDCMRESLEEQHKNELESYRTERNKWQSEADMLRQQLSENRMQLAKGNISLTKELQERDNKIYELSIAYQQLQSEFELVDIETLVPCAAVCDSKMQKMATNQSRGQINQLQAQLDVMHRQVQSMTEKEKTHKSQIFDLKQQLSRRYMGLKTQEQKISQREMQLERKVRSLEEELHKARIQLDKEHVALEAKKVKTAEELALWDKQKRWQQTAEKLRNSLKEKTEEYRKLQISYEKLRSVVSCMEREKWYLKSKLRTESGNIIRGLSARPISAMQYNTVESLQKECHILRDRVRELMDRLENEDNSQLVLKIEEQKRHITALEAVTEGNAHVVDQLEKLETAKHVLEKANINLDSRNLELHLEIEKINLNTSRLQEKVVHLEKYIELLKVEQSSDSTSRLSDKDSQEQGRKKSIVEMEKTIFILKRIIEKLQAENRRLKINSKNNHRLIRAERPISVGTSSLQEQYERAQQRVIALETDLQLAEQRIVMLENACKEYDSNGEVGVLKQQLSHKSELLDKMKQLLTKAAINEKTLRQRVQQLEMRQTLDTIPESFVSLSTSKT